MPQSNESIAQTVSTMSNYYSAYTGEEVDNAIANAAGIMTFIDTHLFIPAAAFTGDYQTVNLATLNRGMWLKEAAFTSVRAFSQSASEITYQLRLSTGETLVTLPLAFVQSTGLTFVYPIEREIYTGTSIQMYCSSTRAYGEFTVKLIMA